MLGHAGMDSGGAPGGGIPWRVVTIESIAADRSHALARDVNSKAIDISLRVRGWKGVMPQVGERWVIDRSLGDWTLVAYLDEQGPPEVTGSRLDNNDYEITALTSLLEALHDLGLIIDSTDTDPRM